MTTSDYKILILPGWQNSGPKHWQSLWEQRHGDYRVQQHDWETPLRGDWICQLESTVLQTSSPILLVAHSLGCHLAAAWAETSPHTSKVCGALLVAPPDLEQSTLPPALYSWRRAAARTLPFASHLISSSNDPYCASSAATQLASIWGSRHTEIGPFGHINSDSGLGDWPQGRAWLLELASANSHPTPPTQP